MKEQHNDVWMKVRSFRSVVSAAYRLYTREWRKMLKAQWIHLLDTAIVTVAAGMLTVYGLYLFIPLVAVAIVLEIVLWLMEARRLTQRPIRSLFRPACRHWLTLLGVVTGGLLALVLPCAVVSMPLGILIMAEWQSQDSMMLGDPAGMPTYMPYLMAAVWFVTAVLQLVIRIFVVYAGYYAWGSAETKRRERNAHLANTNATS